MLSSEIHDYNIEAAVWASLSNQNAAVVLVRPCIGKSRK